MRYKIIICLTFILLGIQSLHAQDYFSDARHRNRNHLILVHPTRDNLQWFRTLVSSGIFDPGELNPVGLYFEDENEDYATVIRDNPDIGFQMIPGGMKPEDVFRQNAFTGAFRLVFENSKGIIFNGGPDIPPSLYGEDTDILTSVTDPHRNIYEVSLLFHLLGGSRNPSFVPFLMKDPKYMVLGICLGMQTMNMATGGTLVQDIPSEIYGLHTVQAIVSSDPDNQHLNYYSRQGTFDSIPSRILHHIRFVKGRWFSGQAGKAVKDPVLVLSSHHQCIDDMGAGLRPVALSMDGRVVEAVEHLKYPNVIGVQFHPEVTFLYDPSTKFLSRPGGRASSFYDRIREGGSYEFHRLFWQDIAKRLQK